MQTGRLAKHPVWAGIAAGLVAGAVTGITDRVLERLVSEEQKRRDRRVREEPAHRHAGPYFAAKLTGRRLSRKEKKLARLCFGIAYGAGWGLIHGKLRKKYPTLSRWGGLLFGIPFFFACDGCIAPLLGVSPGLRRIPWQMSAKEMANHIAWTAAAEATHRAAAGK